MDSTDAGSSPDIDAGYADGLSRVLRAEGLAQVLQAMTGGLSESFSLDAIGLVLLDPWHELRHLLIAGGESAEEFKAVVFVDSLLSLAPQFTAFHRPWLGPYAGADHHLLFHSDTELRSVALVPLPRNDRGTGALCFGSRDDSRFTRRHPSERLAHLGAIAAICLENAANHARLLRAGIADSLTGWHNRRYLHERLQEELARAQRRQTSIACLRLGVDRFKAINDAHGLAAGDNALREVAQRIDDTIRSMDTAARLGGDEFAIVLPDTDSSAAAKLGHRILEAVRATPVGLSDRALRTLTVSVGIAVAAPTRRSSDLKSAADRLLADAHAALYRAKALGRNRLEFGPGIDVLS